MRTVIPIFTTSSTARSRCAGIGVLTHEKAISCGVVGPTARASGIAPGSAPRRALRGLRRDGFRRARGAGRRRARPPVRPRARNHGELPHPSPGAHQNAARRDHTRAATSSPSSPERPPAALKRRAEKSCTASPGKRTPAIQPASTCARPPLPTCPPFAGWCVGARLADTPLIQASIDPCYSCTDR